MKQTNYNPDVLSCLANLSSDEVFTPPVLVNQILDLLPPELWKDKNVKFLDPVSKTGVFLREIAARLIVGLEKEIPDLQERLNHIYNNQIYGIAITELTALMSRRSVYCSKNANGKFSICGFGNEKGNIFFDKTEHDWKNGRCTFCGASQSEYGREEGLETHAYQFIHNNNPNIIKNMKFDVIIGNPPYQLSDGGAQASAMPIYQKFVEQAKKMSPRFLTMIIPSRWFSGGKGLDKFRSEMLSDDRVRVLHDYHNAAECFPGVEIKGGICYFLWDRDSRGLCKVTSHESDGKISETERPLLEKESDAFVRFNGAIDILKKIQKQKEKSFSEIVRPAMTFGFRTFFKDFDSKNLKKGYVKVYANRSQGYIKRDRVEQGLEWADKWKVIIPEAIGVGDMKKDLLKPIISEPGSINTETYIMNGPYKSERETKNVVSYIRTKFFHFLLGLRKNTQHTTRSTYEYIPMQDFNENWTDEKLYKKYKLTKEEVEFIESMIRSME
ncbi:MAG: Eco57I restriction-modification methylase domain-containing protein [Candidatus Wildermuthbacteria bacterium]|nr:Eco57I restriction-modification methylase domain-containing protein [Candidatus Wildermuthbacteria bacterium]